tara:strand:+ start:436 stop:1368 length:933 start_codon:yes stop_codon:yes gene_type:complete
MTIKIASRSSKLALAQVEEFACMCEISDYEIVKIKTEGDIKSARGETFFDKAHFVTDIQKCLNSGEADIAIHSAKDTPAKIISGISRFYLSSKTSKDVMIFRGDNKFDSKMRLGTSSLRRKLQAWHYLKSNNVADLCGNIDTRLEKLHRGDYDCIILAKAGLERLNLLEELNYHEMNWITASGQGTLAAEFDVNRTYFKNAQIELTEIKGKCINYDYDNGTNLRITEERRLLDAVGAGCNSAIALESKASYGDDFKLSINGEIYGKNQYISFSGKYAHDNKKNSLPKSASYEALEDIKSQDGLKLLDEHN